MSISEEHPRYNLPRLRKERDWVSEQLSKDDWGELDMATFRMVTACGTTYCVAGHLASITPGVTWIGSGTIVVAPSAAGAGNFYDVDDWAGDELGLDDDERRGLFYCAEDEVLGELDTLISRAEEQERTEHDR